MIPVISLTTSVLGYPQWQTWTYQPWASNTPTGWTSSALPPGMTLDATLGTLSGAVTVPGVYNVGLQAANADGSSAVVMLTIGIEARAFAPHSGVDIFIDTLTGKAMLNADGSDSGSDFLFAVREGDSVLLWIHYLRQQTALDLGTLTALKVAFKEFDPDATLIIGGGTVADTDFSKVGSGDAAVYVMCATFDGDALKGALSNYEDDAGTFFIGLAQIEWEEPNTTDPLIGPATLRRSTSTFNIRVDREIVA